jgi:hypothetical protein
MNIVIGLAVGLLVILLFVAVLKMAFGLLVALVAIGLAIMAYGIAEKYIGKGR